MNNFYQVIDGLRAFLLLNDFTNLVTFGDIADVDLHKKTNFPLVHIVLRSARIRENTINFTIRLVAADILDVSKEEEADDFLGNNNLQDILATQLDVIVKVVNYFRTNDLVADNFIRVTGEGEATPFLERFENQLAGWEMDLLLDSVMQDQC